MIETADGVKTAEAIASVDGVDGVYIGPNDLTISLGVEAGNARVDKTHRAAVGRVQEACKKAGRITVIHAAGSLHAMMSSLPRFRSQLLEPT